MRSLGVIALIALVFFAECLVGEQNVSGNDDEKQKILENINERYASECNKKTIARWNYLTNPTDVTEKEWLDASEEYDRFKSRVQDEILQKIDLTKVPSGNIKRQLQRLVSKGPGNMTQDDLSKLRNRINEMEKIVNDAFVCEFTANKRKSCRKLSLTPELENRMAMSRNYEELAYYWKAWRAETGRKIRPEFAEYVGMNNLLAQAKGFRNMADMWMNPYADGSAFQETVKRLWSEVEPLYKQLFAHVRRELRKVYSDRIDDGGYIPAHLLGNMWAQDWSGIQNWTRPYKNARSFDVTGALKTQRFTVEKMFQLAENFYSGLGLYKMTDAFWENSILDRPTGSKMTCDPISFQFCQGNKDRDYRMKMCASVDMHSLSVMLHEMGHIEYYMSFEDQPFAFRNVINGGIDEAVGDAIGLSVLNPTHMEAEGLLAKAQDKDEEDINFLYQRALEKLPVLAYSLALEEWRWGVFEGSIPEDEMNEEWWRLRALYQGLIPPVPRTEDDLDSASKIHVAADVSYIRYFLGVILQFQFFESMCREAGQLDGGRKLHECDFSNNKKAGEMLKNLMKLGASESWQSALAVVTNGTELSAKPLLRYFQPLSDFLNAENKKSGDVVGWSTQIHTKDTEEELAEYLAGFYETEASTRCHDANVAQWNYETDIRNETEEAMKEEMLEMAEFEKNQWVEHFNGSDWENFKNDSVRRQMFFLSVLGDGALDSQSLQEWEDIQAKMTGIYSTAKVCPYDNQNCTLEEDGWALDPDLEGIMAESRDADELKYAWVKWRDAAGKAIRDDYKTYVQLGNDLAAANGFQDLGEMWRHMYESPTFKEDILNLWNQIRSFYFSLHSYVRNKLTARYGEEVVGDDGLIPAHLLGNMWAQSWVNIIDLVSPFPNASAVDVTGEMVSQGYTPLKMFQMADEFYQTLGLPSANMCYGPNAMITKPDDREVVCHASAWDFCDGEDFRIKMCTKVNMEDFVTIHHEMGHVEYYLQYKDLPYAFRQGANPGFHEAIGDVIALSVSTPQHLQTVGLLSNYSDTEEDNINALMRMALEKVAFLPFALVVDMWRWDVFAGEVTESNWTSHWWELRQELQGLKPPVARTETDFDPGAKFHVASNSQYMAYFVAHILEFQIHRSLCIEAGQYDPSNPEARPLHKCDIYRSTEAGDKFMAGLKMGSSKHWSDVLETLTGERALNGSAMLEYFKPLVTFLAENPLTREDKVEDVDSTVPIAVGACLAVLVVVVLIAYFYGRWRNRRNAE